jgi:hypothetical protein
MSDSNDPVDQFLKLLENPRVKAFFDNLVNTAVEKKIKESYQAPEFKESVERVIVNSDLQIIPRLQAVFKKSGLYVYGEGEEHEPTLHERIEALEKNTVLAPEKPIEEKKDNSPILPSTSLDFKAVSVMVHLQEEIKPNWAGEICLETKEFYSFMIDKIDQKLRWKPDLRNKREAKKQIFERALEMFPNILDLKKSKSGKHVTGIALKTSGKCRHTYGCS